MKRFTHLIAATLLVAVFAACDGDLEVYDPDDSTSPTNGDSQNGTEDTGAGGDEDTGPTVDSCRPDEVDVECVGTNEFRLCEPLGDFAGEWSDPIACQLDYVCNPDITDDDPCEPTCSDQHPQWGEPCLNGVGVCAREGAMMQCDGEVLVCDAVPGDPEPKECNGLDSNCDGTVDSEGICETCNDDSYAPGNFDYSGATDLLVGDTLDGLVLCDNNADVTSRNWFYLGDASSLHLELSWNPDHGQLVLEIYEQPDFGFPSLIEDTGTGEGQVTYQESFGEVGEYFASVRFEGSDKRLAGVPYTLSHLD